MTNNHKENIGALLAGIISIFVVVVSVNLIGVATMAILNYLE